jgi:hypothetical protein
MRASTIAKTLVAALLIGPVLEGGSAEAQSRHPMPDPFEGVTGTYQTDPDLPVQAELKDCHLFEAVAWGWGTDSLRTRMRMSCQYLSRIGSGGSDRDRATAAALLAFEAEARALLARIERSVADAEPEGAPPRSGSLVIRTGWWADHASQDRLIETHALDLILAD